MKHASAGLGNTNSPPYDPWKQVQLFDIILQRRASSLSYELLGLKATALAATLGLTREGAP